MGEEREGGFACGVCGERHDVLPLSYSVKAPFAVKTIPAEELEERIVMTPDQYVIDGKDFYLRGRILLPVIGLDEPFVWGIWAEVSPKDFIRANELWTWRVESRSPGFQAGCIRRCLCTATRSTLRFRCRLKGWESGHDSRLSAGNIRLRWSSAMASPSDGSKRSRRRCCMALRRDDRCALSDISSEENAMELKSRPS
jgi:hypothetical protein